MVKEVFDSRIVFNEDDIFFDTSKGIYMINVNEEYVVHAVNAGHNILFYDINHKPITNKVSKKVKIKAYTELNEYNPLSDFFDKTRTSGTIYTLKKNMSLGDNQLPKYFEYCINDKDIKISQEFVKNLISELIPGIYVDIYQEYEEEMSVNNQGRKIPHPRAIDKGDFIKIPGEKYLPLSSEFINELLRYDYTINKQNINFCKVMSEKLGRKITVKTI